MRLSQIRISRTELVGWTFVLPTLIGIAAFTVYPALQAFKLSFYQHNGVTGWWVGMYNYGYVLRDSQFWAAAKSTLWIGGLQTALGLPASLIVASLISSSRYGKNMFKAIFFLPNTTSIVAATLIFMLLFFPDETGPMNALLRLVGVGPQRWFSSPVLAPWGIVAIALWHATGYNALIWLAGLQAIPSELYEASEVDGASRLEQWWYITLPAVRPIFVFLVIISLIAVFRRFGDVFVVGGTDGQPAGSLFTLMLYIYRYGFLTFDFGISAAASFIVFMIILGLTLVNFKVLNRE